MKMATPVKSKPANLKSQASVETSKRPAQLIPTPAKPNPAPTVQRRILIVDDHPVFRRGLTDLISGQKGLTVCGEAENLPKTMQAARELKPDLVLMDISIEGTNGIEAIKHLKAEFPTMPVLVVSMHDERLYALRALRAGSLGYVHKGAPFDTIIEGIRTALEGKIFISKNLSNEMIYKMVNGEMTQSPVDVLSDRELEVLQWMGEGRTTRDIADGLRLSVKTVESHCLNMKEKLHFKSRVELVRFAVEWVSCQRS
jgi:DNA-binding NarL/FixJ family response regulator